MLRSSARLAAGVTAGVLAAAVLVSCSRTQAPSAPAATSLKVTDITVGRSVNVDKTIAEKTDSFGPQDIFYVSVKTEGAAPSASVQARWTYEGGQPVSESTQTIAPTGPAVTELHAEKPDGWPAGSYKVEILLDGASAGSRTFDVKSP